MGGWSRQHTRPADVLVPNWVLGTCKPVTLIQLCQDASVTAGSAALAAQIYSVN